MAVLLITYNLTHTDLDYDGLAGRIEEYQHARLGPTSYLIHTRNSPVEVYDELRTFIKSPDSLYVFRIKKPWRGHGHTQTVDWISQNL